MKSIKVNPLLYGVLLCISWPIATTAEEQQDQLPDIEFLEFLGSWQDDDGNWIDPMNFATQMDSTNEQSKEEEQQHE